MISKLAVASALVAVVSAATTPSISSGCASAFGNIAANPDASSCLNPGALLNVATDPNSSIVDPIGGWLNGLCSAKPCSNDTLSAVITNVTSGCSAELSALGYAGDATASIVASVQQLYPTAREVLCLKDNSANKLCATEVLGEFQDIYGTLSINGISGIIAKAASGSVSIPTNISCSDCSKAAYSVLKKNFPDVASSIDTSACPSGFNDGSTPSSISLTASSDKSNGKNGAGMLSVSSIAVAGIVALASAFSFFA